MPFPYEDSGATLSQQSILAGVAGVSAGSGALRVSAITSGSTVTFSGDAANNRVSALSPDAGTFLVSAKSGDGAQLRISAVQDGAAALNVSAKSNDGALLRTSALQSDAALQRVSAIQDGAAALNISAKSNDAALLRTSAIQDGAAALNVSAKSDSANLLRTSAFDSAVTTNTGGTSFFSTSAGIAQTSAIKSSGGRLYGWYLGNPAGVDQYLQIFNVSATTSVTLGTTVPDMRFYVPTLGGSNIPAAGPGIALANGIVVAVTSTADGNTAGASGMRVNLFYA